MNNIFSLVSANLIIRLRGNKMVVSPHTDSTHFVWTPVALICSDFAEQVDYCQCEQFVCATYVPTAKMLAEMPAP